MRCSTTLWLEITRPGQCGRVHLAAMPDRWGQHDAADVVDQCIDILPAHQFALFLPYTTWPSRPNPTNGPISVNPVLLCSIFTNPDRRPIWSAETAADASSFFVGLELAALTQAALAITS